jgi:hypothetical protein
MTITPSLRGKSSINGPCSIAMLDCWRVQYSINRWFSLYYCSFSTESPLDDWNKTKKIQLNEMETYFLCIFAHNYGTLVAFYWYDKKPVCCVLRYSRNSVPVCCMFGLLVCYNMKSHSARTLWAQCFQCSRDNYLRIKILIDTNSHKMRICCVCRN